MLDLNADTNLDDRGTESALASRDGACEAAPGLPIVDISKLHGTQEERAAMAEELRAILHRYGFFYLRGHGVDPAVTARGAVRFKGLLRLAGRREAAHRNDAFATLSRLLPRRPGTDRRGSGLA